jgi:hypothetical protein
MAGKALAPFLLAMLVAAPCGADFPSTSHWDSVDEGGWACIDRNTTDFPGTHHGVAGGTGTPDPESAYFVFFPEGWPYGGEPAHCWNTYPEPQTEVWLQFWFMWSAGYDFNGIRNKMFYQWIGPGSSNNHFIYTSGGGGHVGFEMQGAESGTWESNTGYDPFIDSGVWYKGKAHFVLNSPGADDGVFQLWIDDGLVIDLADVRYRAADEGDKGFHEMSITPVYGGMGGGDVSHDQYLYVDLTILSATDPGGGADEDEAEAAEDVAVDEDATVSEDTAAVEDVGTGDDAWAGDDAAAGDDGGLDMEEEGDNGNGSGSTGSCSCGVAL